MIDLCTSALCVSSSRTCPKNRSNTHPVQFTMAGSGSEGAGPRVMAAESARPCLLVLYGSQTGTAEDVAERVGREARRRHIQTRVVSMDAYPIQQLISEQYIVMVAATTGQGDEPDAMRPFWRFLLRKNLPTTSLANVGGIAVFGLGDSSYTKFNYSAIKLHKRLGQIGATFIAGLGLADDQHLLGVDGALEPWLEELWTNLLARIPLPPGREIIPDTVRAAPRFAISVVNPPSSAGVEAATCVVRPNAPPHAIEAAMVRNERMTSVGHFQDVRHITLATGSALQHVPGDVLYIMPKNPPALVAEVAGYFGLSHDTLLRLDPEPGGAGPAVPAYFTDTSGRPVARSAMAVLTEYLDIQAVPRRYFFELLASFATDLREAERLRELCSAEGQDDLLAYCNRMKRTSIEALRDFPSAQAGLQLEYLFDLFRPIQPRAFSISSALAATPGQTDLTIAIVEYKTRLATPRVGVCTSWLADLPAGEDTRLHVWAGRGTFRVPKWDIPLIMVGPGTGCAPFMAILQHRVAEANKAGGVTLNVLFFGNRNRDGDFLHRGEWEKYERLGVLRLHTAFSRDQEDKIYVQHRMVEQGAVLWELLDNQGAVCLVAGNSKRMPIDVRDALCDAVEQHGEMPPKSADEYITELEGPKVRRVQFETW